MTEEAKEARRAYKREWARKNPDKVRAQAERYWTRKSSRSIETTFDDREELIEKCSVKSCLDFVCIAIDSLGAIEQEMARTISSIEQLKFYIGQLESLAREIKKCHGTTEDTKSKREGGNA
jgi:hypothetical protein